MIVDKDCPSCGAVYEVDFHQVDQPVDEEYDISEETFEDDAEVIPEFCPFCGRHEDEEEPEESDK